MPAPQPWLPRILLAAAVILCYSRTLAFDFVSYDDWSFLHEQPVMWTGFNATSIAWAFSLDTPTGWNPLAWLSHLLDCTLFGKNPAGHHAVNVALHLANVLLLFELLRRLAINLWPAAAVASLLALHPLHVESVAWVAERRDVLSLCFGLLTLHAHVRYAGSPSLRRYLIVVALTAAALMSKPMMVTLPCLLLLLDAWPLARLSRRAVIEKLPLFALALLAAALTWENQRRTAALQNLIDYPFLQRLDNALVSYLTYLGQALWPFKLAFFYPVRHWPWWLPALAAAVLLAVTLVAFRRRRDKPWILFGWLWYLGTLVPVIGIVQVGLQAHADRYTYLPMIGIYLALILTLANWRCWRPAFCVVAILLALRCFNQTAVWRDSMTLYAHALDVTTDNAVAHINYGSELLTRNHTGDIDAAAGHFEQALHINPDDPSAAVNLARIRIRRNHPEQAIDLLNPILARHPGNPKIHFELARALHMLGDIPRAITHLQSVLAADPAHTPAQQMLHDLRQLPTP